MAPSEIIVSRPKPDVSPVHLAGQIAKKRSRFKKISDFRILALLECTAKKIAFLSQHDVNGICTHSWECCCCSVVRHAQSQRKQNLEEHRIGTIYDKPLDVTGSKMCVDTDMDGLFDESGGWTPPKQNDLGDPLGLDGFFSALKAKS